MEAQELFVGIDVSKSSLDVAVHPTGEAWRVANDPDGVQRLAERLASLGPQRIVLEATGGYERLAVGALRAAGLPAVLVNPGRVRYHARAMGQLAKTDRIDASVIAHFAAAVRPEVRPLPDEAQQRLAGALTRRQQLVQMLTAEKNHKGTAHSRMLPGIQAHIASLQEQIAAVEQDIDQQIQDHTLWREKREILESFPGIGRVSAVALVSDVPELGQLNRKQISALIGLAPLNNDSGRRRGQRSVWGGRARVRSILYMAAMCAIRHNPVIKAFYERLLRAGKKHIVALVACMHKMLIILNAMVRTRTPWCPDAGPASP